MLFSINSRIQEIERMERDENIPGYSKDRIFLLIEDKHCREMERMEKHFILQGYENGGMEYYFH